MGHKPLAELGIVFCTFLTIAGKPDIRALCSIGQSGLEAAIARCFAALIR